MDNQNEFVNSVYYKLVCDLLDDNSCDEYVHNKDDFACDTPFFSFMMATYNDDRLLNSAINSLFKQDFKNWELVVVDNSDNNENVWRLLTKASIIDRRIKIIRLEKNVGWPKAASICMKHITGKYTSFLAADDCLNHGALSYLYNEIISRDNPDIVWVGHANTEYNQGSVNFLGGLIPPKNDWNELNRSSAIAEIMKEIYYNSFFHYMKVDFLRKENIDFFDPYYADCGGMTRAMARANKMCSVDKIIYFLTGNTSQTKGRYTLGCYEFMFANQWKSVRQVFLDEKYDNKDNIRYVAMRILYNLFGQVSHLCEGRCRDKYQCHLEIGKEEIANELNNILTNNEIKEMLEIGGLEGFLLLVKSIKNIKIIENDENWIYDLVKLGGFVEKNDISNQLKQLIKILSNKENSDYIGMPYFIYLTKNCGEDIFVQYMQEIKSVIRGYTEYINPKVD